MTKRIRAKKVQVPFPSPSPHPEQPPPNIPIPGEPTEGNEKLFKCKICGKAFSIKIELDVHMETDHAKRQESQK